MRIEVTVLLFLERVYYVMVQHLAFLFFFESCQLSDY